ncbi:MAG: serine/threonine-protein kinase, partial [Polyangiaceae bacterium]
MGYFVGVADRAPSRDDERESRYALYEEIASGGMATVHIGRLTGAIGFARTVAIKRMHRHLSRDADFVSMFVDEARLAARIRHPNVVATLDVVQVGGELLLIMEYVHGESLSGLARAARRRGERIAPVIATSVASGLLFGLHAAHEASDERGVPLEIVHRDVTPANVLVGADGIARVLDFGIATANVRVQTTREGQMKGKLRYMAPEQLRDQPATRRTDVYGASVVLWETLTGERLFWASNEGAIITKVLESVVPPPSRLMDDVPAALDAVVLKGLARDPAARFPTAREMALALEGALAPAPAHAVGDWVDRTMGDVLRLRAELIACIEAAADGTPARAQPLPSEVTASHTFTLRDATLTALPARRPTLTTAAAPEASSSAAPAPPRPTATQRLPALAAAPRRLFVTFALIDL